jgi:hypothetical protein
MRFWRNVLINITSLVVSFLILDLFNPGLLSTLFRMGVGVLGPAVLVILLVIIVLSRERK